MEETERLKAERATGYRLEDSIYLLVDFGTGKVPNRMTEVAVLYDGAVLLKHGHPDLVNFHFRRLRKTFDTLSVDHLLHVIQGKIPIEELDKMLSITGYLPKEILESIKQLSEEE